MPPPPDTPCVHVFFEYVCRRETREEGGKKRTQRRVIHLPLRTALYYYIMLFDDEPKNKIRDRFTNVALNIMRAQTHL